MSRLRQLEQQAYGVRHGDSGNDADAEGLEDHVPRASDSLLGESRDVSSLDTSRKLLKHSRPLSEHQKVTSSKPTAVHVAKPTYEPRNQAHLIQSPSLQDVNPHAIGTLDYPSLPSEWGCCCCIPGGFPRCLYKRKIGAAYLCCEGTRSNGEPKVICMLGAGWSFSLATYGLIYGTSGLVFAGCFTSLTTSVAILYACIWSFGVLSLACTGCGDPGIFPLYSQPKAPNWRYCAKTKSFRPPGVVYCSESGFLVEDLDHFCPWTGTTIAKNNMCCFQTFLAMIMVTLVATLVMVGAAGASHTRGGGRWGSPGGVRGSPAVLRAQKEHAVVEYFEGGTVCGTSSWWSAAGRTGYGTLDLMCEDHKQTITEITFADWGDSVGDCGEYVVAPSCTVEEDRAAEWVGKLCVGKRRCSLQPAHVKELGDPCPGLHKRLVVQAQCA